MKIATVNVTCCRECPHRARVIRSRCNLVKDAGVPRRITFLDGPVPHWCPLPDQTDKPEVKP